MQANHGIEITSDGICGIDVASCLLHAIQRAANGKHVKATQLIDRRHFDANAVERNMDKSSALGTFHVLTRPAAQ